MLAWFLYLLLVPKTLSLADHQGQARTPPRGWNSYDSYSWVISEQQFLDNAKLVSQKLLHFGYEYVVVDFLWYRKAVPGASVRAAGFDNIDEWGRPIPDPVRWPSSSGGKGLKPIADQVHAMGLKFGIHVMRGINTQAVSDNTLILGKLNQTWKARDIALQNQPCSWMPQCFLRVNESTEGGKAFIQSLYDLYASWEVDFVKHDCVFGVDDLSIEEITTVSQAIASSGRPMLYSISPGVEANPTMATLVNSFVNMYRVTGDDWDTWHDLQSHFDVARDFAAAGLIGATGLLGISWPDLDMLPIGYLTDPGANHGPSRLSRLSLEEQRTQMTLWAMARSPLMFGGDMMNIENTTIDILTNPVALEINANSFGNMEVQISDVMKCYIPAVSLVDCEAARGTYWRLLYSTASENTLQLYWTNHEHLRRDGCLYWQPPHANFSAQIQEIITQQTTTGVSTYLSGQASIHKKGQNCLEAQGDMQTTFSRCTQERTQIWHVNPNGKLVSNTTRLCAIVNLLKFNSTIEQRQSIDTRIWMARGAQGEYYVALFNLEEQPIYVSLPLSGIVGAGIQIFYKRGDTDQDHGRECTRPDWQCKGQEAWTNQDIGTVKDRLHATLAPHGCALFSLSCSLI